MLSRAALGALFARRIAARVSGADRLHRDRRRLYRRHCPDGARPHPRSIQNNSAGQRAAWAQATTSFALLQAPGAYGLSYAFERSGEHYAMLFVVRPAAVTAGAGDRAVHALRRQRRGRTSIGVTAKAP
jgi:hypothetical protein